MCYGVSKGSLLGPCYNIQPLGHVHSRLLLMDFSQSNQVKTRGRFIFNLLMIIN